MEATHREVPPAEACAQAAAWIARLHGEARTPKVEAGFRRWLAADPAHRAAFEMANEVWEGAERWPKPDVWVWSWPRAVMAAGLLAAVLLGGRWFWQLEHTIVTDVGEQRSLTLEDGTRVLLNTATRVRLDYRSSVRRVVLASGEALFEVARHPGRPFVVIVGERQITALGTAFVVQREPHRMAVTLMDGQVAVEAVTGESEGRRQVLEPGERITFSEGESPRVDRPVLAAVTAWQRNQIVLDHTPLSEAVREMNRYSRRPLSIERAEAADLEVTGVFRAGDSVNFARAVAETYGLRVDESARQVVISGVPLEVF